MAHNEQLIHVLFAFGSSVKVFHVRGSIAAPSLAVQAMATLIVVDNPELAV